MAGRDYLGITVLADFILSEGVEPIIETCCGSERVRLPSIRP